MALASKISVLGNHNKKKEIQNQAIEHYNTSANGIMHVVRYSNGKHNAWSTENTNRIHRFKVGRHSAK
jgi:hypothetical protein